jgi:hypothetical protein
VAFVVVSCVWPLTWNSMWLLVRMGVCSPWWGGGACGSWWGGEIVAPGGEGVLVAPDGVGCVWPLVCAGVRNTLLRRLELVLEDFSGRYNSSAHWEWAGLSALDIFLL